MAASDTPAATGQPLQLVTLNMAERKVEVNEDALGRLEKSLNACGTRSVAVVSVMGAFRTGKSFLLDLFLRYLRYEEHLRVTTGETPGSTPAPNTAPVQLGAEDAAVPDWVSSAGESIEGGLGKNHEGGFRFKGGMDACTEGIWVWSEPFIRTINGKEVAVILMDTQGAWDSNMTKEQSATIFGLTAVLSSKQIYNINMQIQEDKVENLAYFMRFAQAALRKASDEYEKSGNKLDEGEVNKPFQCLDFLVRDWMHFGDDWGLEQCREQMDKHLSKHVNPESMVEKSTAEALHSMFHRINCFCLPHPGLAIQKETWKGNVKDISKDFLQLVSVYVRDVFTEGLNTKSILGSELSTLTFPYILRDFVNAFHDAAPAAMSFTQAMTSCTVLLAKEQSMKMYTKRMDEAVAQAPRGLEPKQFEQLAKTVNKEIEAEYNKITIFGSEDTRDDTWKSIQESLQTLHQKYYDDNARRLEKALAAFANIALLGCTLFGLDRVSDWTCDWWSQTCVEVSKCLLSVYLLIFGYIGVQVYFLFNDRGRLGAAVAGGELWKEMMRLLAVYAELLQHTNWSEFPALLKAITSGKGLAAQAESLAQAQRDAKDAKDNKKKN